MEFIKNLFKDENRVVGLCGFKEEDKLHIFIPKTNRPEKIYKTDYQKNFFLM